MTTARAAPCITPRTNNRSANPLPLLLHVLPTLALALIATALSAPAARADLAQYQQKITEIREGRAADIQQQMLPLIFLTAPHDASYPSSTSFEAATSSLAGQDLSGLDLRDEEFAGANLQGTNFAGADLRRSNFHKADLRGANLAGADLSHAILEGAILSGANLQNAVLGNTILSYARLDEADLRGAQMHGTFAPFVDLTLADLSGAVLNRAVLNGALLQKARMKHIVAKGSHFWGATFTEVDLSNSDFDDCLFRAALFHRSRFQDMRMQRSRFHFVEFADNVALNADLGRNHIPDALTLATGFLGEDEDGRGAISPFFRRYKDNKEVPGLTGFSAMARKEVEFLSKRFFLVSIEDALRQAERMIAVRIVGNWMQAFTQWKQHVVAQAGQALRAGRLDMMASDKVPDLILPNANNPGSARGPASSSFNTAPAIPSNTLEVGADGTVRLPPGTPLQVPEDSDISSDSVDLDEGRALDEDHLSPGLGGGGSNAAADGSAQSPGAGGELPGPVISHVPTISDTPLALGAGVKLGSMAVFRGMALRPANGAGARGAAPAQYFDARAIGIHTALKPYHAAIKTAVAASGVHAATISSSLRADSFRHSHGALDFDTKGLSQAERMIQAIDWSMRLPDHLVIVEEFIWVEKKLMVEGASEATRRSSRIAWARDQTATIQGLKPSDTFRELAADAPAGATVVNRHSVYQNGRLIERTRKFVRPYASATHTHIQPPLQKFPWSIYYADRFY